MISVILASHNGTGTLPLTLEALTALRLPQGGVEFLAVDNASDDGTRDLLESYVGHLPLRVLVEPRRGKSFALNRALDEVAGDLVVFMDDDILPVPQWLEAFAQAAAAYPQVGVFAGQVRHHWQKPPPAWLKRLAEEGRSYAGTPLDQPEGPVPAIFFKGANFMIRRALVDSLRFSEAPGVNFAGQALAAGGEDTAFVQQALSQGAEARYVREACVQHIVRPQQVGLWPVFLRYLRIGRSMALSNPQTFDPAGAKVLGYPRYLFRTVPQDVLRALLREETLLPPCPEGLCQSHYERAVALSRDVGELAAWIAGQQGAGETAIAHAQLAGLLHGLGRLLLCNQATQDYAKVLALVSAGARVEDAERETFGSSQADFGAYLAQIWGLPQVVVDALRLLERPSAGEVSEELATPLLAAHSALGIVTGINAPEPRTAAAAHLDGDFLVQQNCEGKIEDWVDGWLKRETAA